MKLPHDAAEAVFTIGERKFALFLSFALVAVEDHDIQSGLLFRPGEVSCISHTPDAQKPFDLTTVHLEPTLVAAADIDDAAATIAEQIKAVGERILSQQTEEVSADGEVSEAPSQECCEKPEACENKQLA